MLLVVYLEEPYVQTEIGPVTGDARPAHSQDAGSRADARLGDHAENPADIRRRTAGQPGIALSGAIAIGTAGMDRIRVGRVGEQPSGEVLPPGPERAETVGGRDRELEAAFGGHRTDSAGDLNRRRRLCFTDSGIAFSLNSAERSGSGRWKRSCAFIWRWRPRRTSVAGWARKRLDWLRGEVSAESNRRKSHIAISCGSGGSTTFGRTCITARELCSKIPASLWSRSSPWRWASGRTRLFSASGMRCS